MLQSQFIRGAFPGAEDLVLAPGEVESSLVKENHNSNKITLNEAIQAKPTKPMYRKENLTKLKKMDNGAAIKRDPIECSTRNAERARDYLRTMKPNRSNTPPAASDSRCIRNRFAASSFLDSLMAAIG